MLAQAADDTPAVAARAPGSAADGSGSGSGAGAAAGDDCLPAAAIDNAQQFYAWFAELEARADAQHEAAFHAYAALLRGYNSQCSEVWVLVCGCACTPV